MSDFDKLKQKFLRLYEGFEMSTGPEVQLGEWWIPSVKHFLSILENSANPVDAVQRCQMTAHFTIYTQFDDRTRIELYVKWMIDYLEKSGINLELIPRSVAESPYCLPQNLVEAPDGRIVSPDLMRTLELWYSILGQLNSGQKLGTIFELGGGYGGTARAGKLLLPDATVFLCDLPTSLFFSYQYIDVNFPDSKILLIENKADLDRSLRDFDFVFLSPQHARYLREFEFDLFINTNSLTEMNTKTVEFWFEWVQSNKHCQYLFLDNRFLGYHSVGNFRKDECACFFCLDRNWEFLNWSFDDPAHHSPYIASIHCRTLRVLAERRANPLSISEAKSLSDKLIADVQCEDWFQESYVQNDNGKESVKMERFFDRGPRTFGCHRFNGTSEGTLFKLFEAFRYSQNLESHYMLNIYLQMISQVPVGNITYEELDFLQALDLSDR